MDKIKGIFKNNLRQYAMLLALVVIMALFQYLTHGILLKPQNVTNLILQNSYVIILAIGMVLCILTGGNIDLSVGSVVAIVGAITGTLIVTMKVSIPVAIIIGIFVGVLIGVWQGFWIAYVRIPAFIVTLAGMLLFRGLTLIVLQGKTISPFPKAFLQISGGFVPDFLGKNPNFNATTILVSVIISVVYLMLEIKKRVSKKKYGFDVLPVPFFIAQLAVILAVLNLFAFWLATYKGIPVILVILAVLIVVYSFITTKTTFGRHIYAIGGNEKAAKLSGVNTNKVLFLTYVNMGVLSAITGIVFTARLMAATPTAGNNFELDAIAACFIGGASATGGVGTVIGAIIGALVMGVLNNGMSILGVGSDWQMAIKGSVLLAAVAFDIISKNKSK
ncbi:multiple monosaccharide ABC transporter permease [Clostridium neuense]|uniref:Xylose transport system permease protein XylH n=1 Tax=Clostridium neuense TaxID=1728934 RepID=A0ABW8THD1_9CLOT